ncbi:uncharacterized protein EI90DRAFT_1965133 [Cantharellus anzutake]|uniref:uncharacterized protein n=1 Tax=Cantharellus anzutake TaxID=1750568 RepID=UPI00190724D2|nr:uncharacterized protein EI90DRAFT_1965133 [Cantharellus anzutake]KAF8326201.1 hypothetical protein EI90DRAFT_1965133 [Cantharellus anzutake]
MDEAQATLQPISSIIELPLEDMGVKFYHATAQEFITGNPIGDENDKIFFINDKKGYFLGPLLLQILNNCCKENIPTDPLSDKKKWVDFKLKWEQPKHIQYVIENIRFHLDPAKLFSQESNNNELQNKFNSFLTQNLLTYLHMGGDLQGFDEFNDHDVVGLQQESAAICWGIHQWLLHRSMSLLFPPKSSLYKLYGHLSEPVQSFSISGEISNHLIPLSKALLNTQNLMEAKLDGLPKDNKQGSGVINYEAEFQELDVRNGIVTCAALSRDGRYVALGLGSGVIEIADIDDQCTISQFQNHPPNPPAWIEFIHDGHCIATEDVDGNISIYGHGVPPLKLGTLPTGAYPAVTAVSASGFFIVTCTFSPLPLLPTLPFHPPNPIPS